MDDKLYGHLILCNGWSVGPRNSDFTDHTTPRPESINYMKVGPLSGASHQRELRLLFDVSRSCAEALKPGRKLTGIREPSQKNRQSRKCLVRVLPWLPGHKGKGGG